MASDDHSPADQVGDEGKHGPQDSGGGEHHGCSVGALGCCRDRKASVRREGRRTSSHVSAEKPTRCILGLVDGDSGGGQGQAAEVAQGDVDAVGAGLGEAPPETHLTLGRGRDVVAHDGSHLSAAGVRHDGAG